MKKTTIAMALLCLMATFCFSQNRVSVMFYNLLNFPNINEAGRTDDLTFILNTYRPDVFAVCELNNSSGATSILNILQAYDSTYQMATFVTNSSDDTNGDSNSLQQLVFYNHKVLLETQHTPLATTLRDINHYTFKLNSEDVATDPIRFDFYIAHLKASSGVTNEAIRADMVNVFTADLNNLPVDRPVIFAGDLNMYNSSEPANVELLDNTNNITLIDPINRQGSWHNNSGFNDVFTQSTSTTSVNGGASGGFDDRFDFIYLSENFLTNPDLLYTTNSYRAIGNNGNPLCFNDNITDADCSGTEYSSQVRDALYNFSDHLPVFLEIQTDQLLSVNDQVAANDSLLSLPNGNIVSETLILQSKNLSTQQSRMLIYNTLGQVVKHVTITNNSLINVNISDFSNGMYYIQLENSNIEALKFIKK